MQCTEVRSRKLKKRHPNFCALYEWQWAKFAAYFSHWMSTRTGRMITVHPVTVLLLLCKRLFASRKTRRQFTLGFKHGMPCYTRFQTHGQTARERTTEGTWWWVNHQFQDNTNLTTRAVAAVFELFKICYDNINA